MRKVLVFALAAATVAALAVAGVAAAASHGYGKRLAAVTITKVSANGNTGCISLKLDIRGWKMYPGRIGSSRVDSDGGHYHVYVNGKYFTAGKSAKRARACGLESGRSYQLQVVLSHNNHLELNARSQEVSAILR